MMRKERGRETEGKGQGGRGGKRRGERGGGDTHNFGVCVPPPLLAKSMKSMIWMY
tara:strand:- start:137 stop:301 length:165 start_codon:yes stop_codon:yes gene_type:complete